MNTTTKRHSAHMLAVKQLYKLIVKALVNLIHMMVAMVGTLNYNVSRAEYYE